LHILDNTPADAVVSVVVVVVVVVVVDRG